MIRLRNNAGFTCPNNALTVIPFDTIDHYTFGAFDLVNGKIIIPKDGWYVAIGGMLGWASNSTNERAQYLTLNGATNFAREVKGSVDNAPIAYMTVTGVVYCRANDYIQHFGYQNSGGSLVIAQPTLCVIQMS